MTEDNLQQEFLEWPDSNEPIALNAQTQAQFEELDRMMNEFRELRKKSTEEFNARLKELKLDNSIEAGKKRVSTNKEDNQEITGREPARATGLRQEITGKEPVLAEKRLVDIKGTEPLQDIALITAKIIEDMQKTLAEMHLKAEELKKMAREALEKAKALDPVLLEESAKAVHDSAIKLWESLKRF